MKKTIIASMAALLISVNGFGWGVTAHTVIAYLGYQYASSTSQKAIVPLLQTQLSVPGPITCTVNSNVKNPENYLASAISPWPDDIKYIPVSGWGQAGSAAQSFYANAHFIDINFNYGQVANLDTATALDIASAQISADAQPTPSQAANDDLYYVLRSCIKSLAMSQDPSTASQISNNEVVFALRHLIHLTGDNTEPLHMSNPMFVESGVTETSYGGNEIHFSSDYKLKGNNSYMDVSELHELWDNPGDTFVPVLNNNSDSDTQIYIDYTAASQITDIANSLKETYASYKPNIDNNVGCSSDLIMSWTTQSYATAVANVCNGLGPILSSAASDGNASSCRSGYAPDGSVNPSKIGTIAPPTNAYVEAMGPIAALQIYMSSVRLGDLITAIYDPANAPQSFVEYVNNIKSDSSIPTVNQLMQVYY